jgi:pimeloyl-ACP methyl ester carboxylesterase
MIARGGCDGSEASGSEPYRADGHTGPACPDTPVTPPAGWASATTVRCSGWAAIEQPVFVANGDSDPMILPHYSYLLAGLIPQARVKIYPDSAHGFLFQHHAEFNADVDEFLSNPR